MVAKTPSKQNQMLAALNPVLIRETLNKVDQCIIRLQKLQYMLISGFSLRTSLRSKEESVRIKNGAPRRSPRGKFPRPANLEGEWRQMSLPAMLVGETVGEILQASQFARKIVSAIGRKTATEDPKTPPSQRSNLKVDPEKTQLKTRRQKEKQIKLQSDSQPPQRVRSRINFKVSPSKVREFDEENNNKYLANRVSPSHRLCASKRMLFPNPSFLSASSRKQQFCKTRSTVISRNRGTQHKFLIKSPPSPSTSTSKFQVKVKSPLIVSTSSPTRPTSLIKKTSPKKSCASKLLRSFSPSRLAIKLVSTSKGKKNA
ncbi:hypothetical protein VNO77_18375 [Canavalia gladiata]|uniref:Microtubule-binding protein TANGLED n=1 Tax=Canavalia gladiata TaxID=3824 RepID=A0AAN9QNM4_CANGL